MDIPRDRKSVTSRRRWRWLVVLLGIAALAALAISASQLTVAVPTVERASLWIDHVTRGPLVVEARGPGSLVPERFRWVTAVRAGRVERIFVAPGTRVSAETVLIALSNPEVEQAVVEAEYIVRTAEADALALERQQEQRDLDLEATLTAIERELREAQLRLNITEKLHGSGDISRLDHELAQSRVETQARLLDIHRRRVAVDARVAVTERDRAVAVIAQHRATLALRHAQAASLHVVAGFEGMLDQITVEIGQYVDPGATLARVIGADHLKAVVRIPEAQARDLRFGQTARIDTGAHVLDGVVSRIDPAVRAGAITVDLRLVGQLPRGARPDLNVTARIQLSRIDDALFVGRPAFARENATLSLFRVDADEAGAQRVAVRIGQTSVASMQVIGGLGEGDAVILSEMGQFDHANRIRLR